MQPWALHSAAAAETRRACARSSACLPAGARVSTHRYHHLHCDTPLDPHSPYEGFWWSHITWLFSTEASMLDYANAPDLKSQPFYRFLETFYLPILFVIKPYLTYQLGGLELVVWTLAVPMVLGWHSTFLVNSAAHVYGRRPYDTGARQRRQRHGQRCCDCMQYVHSLARHRCRLLTLPAAVAAGDLSTNCWWVAAVSFGEGW